MAKYGLVRPCPHCPFRTDVPKFLTQGRVEEIATSIARGSEFWCHETTVEIATEDDGMDMGSGPNTQVCAGALITQEKSGNVNQITRIAERIGMYDRTRMDMSAPVYDSLTDWQMSYTAEAEPIIICETTGPDCLAPAGMMVDGVVILTTEGLFEGDNCEECGSPLCENCADDEGRCGNCADEEDDDEDD